MPRVGSTVEKVDVADLATSHEPNNLARLVRGTSLEIAATNPVPKKSAKRARSVPDLVGRTLPAALLQDAIARATRMAAEQNLDIDPHDAAARLPR